MKKRLITSFFLLPSVLIAAEESPNNEWVGFKLQYSPWLASWEQTSTAASRFGSSAIDMDYRIDSALAHSVRADFRIWKLSSSLESIETSEAGSIGDKALSFLSMGLNYKDFIGSTSISYRLLQSRFEGSLTASSASKYGSATFATDLLVHDIGLMFKQGVGFGYRYMDYVMPQDLYLIDIDSPNKVLESGLGDVAYSAHYLMGLIQDDDVFDTSTDKRIGLAANIRFGYGIIEASGDDVDAYNSAIKALNGGKDVISGGTSYFYDIDANVYKNLKFGSHVTGKVAIGYRFNYLKGELEAEGQYALVTDFESTFSGPYLHFMANY